MNLVIDSNVIISALKVEEEFHKESVEFINKTTENNEKLYIPTTIFWEVGSTLLHKGKTPKSTKFSKNFEFRASFINIDTDLFFETWNPKLRLFVKGADRIFLSCALYKDAKLVTWDQGLIKNGHLIGVDVITPKRYLAL